MGVRGCGSAEVWKCGSAEVRGCGSLLLRFSEGGFGGELGACRVGVRVKREYGNVFFWLEGGKARRWEGGGGDDGAGACGGCGKGGVVYEGWKCHTGVTIPYK